MSLAVAWGVASLGEEASVFYVVSLGDSLIADRKIQRSNEKHIQGVWNAKRYTPPKTNMEPENEPLEEEIPMKNHHF